MSLLKLAAISFLVTMTLGNPMPVDAVKRDEDPYAYYKDPHVFSEYTW